MNSANKELIINIYYETVDEAMNRGESNLKAHMEGIIASSMLLSSIDGIEDEEAKRAVIDLKLKPLI